MILRPCYNPLPLISVASSVAYDLRDAAREMRLEDLERVFCPSDDAAIGVLARVRFDKDGAYQSVGFEVVAKPSEISPDEFYCSVPVAKGYWHAENDLAQAAENFWFAREADQRLEAFGRELIALSDEDLDAISPYRRRLTQYSCSKDLNNCLLTEVAIRERKIRLSDSNHERIAAMADLEPTIKVLAEEAKQAIFWWEGLTSMDRRFFPTYDCERMEYGTCAIFTYRDFLEKNRRRQADRSYRLDRSSLRVARRTKRKGSMVPPAETAA